MEWLSVCLSLSFKKERKEKKVRKKWNDRQSQANVPSRSINDGVSFYGLLIPNLSCTPGPRSSNIGQYHALFSQYASDTNLHTARVTRVVNREVAWKEKEREREREKRGQYPVNPMDESGPPVIVWPAGFLKKSSHRSLKAA